jgi:hypothetical protein
MWGGWRVRVDGLRTGCGLLVAAALLTLGSQAALAAGGDSAAPVPPAVSQFLSTLQGISVAAPATGATPAIGKAQPGALDSSSVRLRVTLPSAQFGDVSVYAGRTANGLCWVILRGGHVSGQCSSDNVPASSPVVVGFDSNSAGWDLVDGHTYSSKARSLRVRFTSGSTLDVPVSGRFFVFELGPDHSAFSSDPPVSLEVLDASGASLGTRVDPMRLHARRPNFVSALASSVRLRAQLTLPASGGHVTLSSGRDAAGDGCMRVLLNGASALTSFLTWQCGVQIGRYGDLLDTQNPKVVHRVPVSWTLGRSGNTLLSSHTFAYGYVAPSTARLELRFQDGASTNIDLHAGFFAYEIPTSAYADGHRPSELQAYAASGSRVYTQPLYPTRPCVYPGADPACAASNGGANGGFVSSVATTVTSG